MAIAKKGREEYAKQKVLTERDGIEE